VNVFVFGLDDIDIFPILCSVVTKLIILKKDFLTIKTQNKWER
jgi:hypothetical protein